MEKKKRGRPPKTHSHDPKECAGISVTIEPRIKARPCPFDKKPCPMTEAGCAAWDEWRIYKAKTETVVGCSHFGILAHDMLLMPEATKHE